MPLSTVTSTLRRSPPLHQGSCSLGGVLRTSVVPGEGPRRPQPTAPHSPGGPGALASTPGSCQPAGQTRSEIPRSSCTHRPFCGRNGQSEKLTQVPTHRDPRQPHLPAPPASPTCQAHCQHQLSISGPEQPPKPAQGQRQALSPRPPSEPLLPTWSRWARGAPSTAILLPAPLHQPALPCVLPRASHAHTARHAVTPTSHALSTVGAPQGCSRLTYTPEWLPIPSCLSHLGHRIQHGLGMPPCSRPHSASSRSPASPVQPSLSAASMMDRRTDTQGHTRIHTDYTH